MNPSGRGVEPILQTPDCGAAAKSALVPARAGIGLRFPHHRRVLAERPDTAWFEVHPENYLRDQPAALELERVRLDYPVSLHATALSLGSASGVDPRHLDALAALERRIEPGLVSDHLSWSAAAGVYLPDLLPLPFTGEALGVLQANVGRVQDRLGRAILVENPSTYLRLSGAALSEAEMLGELVRRAGCGVLLDVNNVFVSAWNLGEDPAARLDALLDEVPADAIGEIHLAGHAERRLADGAILRIDDHSSAVSAPVWRLYERAVVRLGRRPTLIEWDNAIPAFEVLQDQAEEAQARMDRICEPRHALAG